MCGRCSHMYCICTSIVFRFLFAGWQAAAKIFPVHTEHKIYSPTELPIYLVYGGGYTQFDGCSFRSNSHTALGHIQFAA